ncbi:MAG: dienelactone hydrolase family protein [Mycobacterium sp.]
MPSTKKLFAELLRKGPHKVMRGELAFAGLPGVVFTPAAGLNLPGVAFGHDWLTRSGSYRATLEHLASWGIVAAAPDTERGLAPSALNLAFDLGTTLDIITGVRLGAGGISVHPTKVGVAGHGFGASAAVFTAAGAPNKVTAVAALYPAVTRPDASEPAATLQTKSGLVLTAPDDSLNMKSNAAALVHHWPGATMRMVSKSASGGMAEGRRLAKAFGLPGSDRRTQRVTRALLTGFLLATLAGDKAYRDFADPDGALPGTSPVAPDGDPVTMEDKFVALLKQ